MSKHKRGSKLYSLSMFLVVSVVCGILTAGLALPMVAISGGTVKTAAESLEYLPAELAIPPVSTRSQVLMADGSLLAEFYDENRIPVKLDQIAQVMQDAQIAIEDHRFYEHGAIDLRGMARAFTSNIFGNDRQGGSTLTQQYVKQVRIETAMINNDERALYKASELTISRKIIEMRYAVALEKRFSKQEILERYLNIAYYGDGAYGVEAAARHYFNATAATLTLDQAAMLAGLVQNPNYLNPVANPRLAIERRNVVLDAMLRWGYISKEEAESAKQVGFDPTKVTSTPNGCLASRFPFICDYVERTLMYSDILGGKTPEENRNLLRRGGYTIQTLIDPEAQAAAEESVNKIIDPQDPVIGTTVLLESQTGMIVAMAQSRPKMGTGPGEVFWNYNVSAQMGGTEGYQAGSTFKIYSLAAGLEEGLTPKHRINATSPINFKGQKFESCEGEFTQTQDWNVRNTAGHSGNIDMLEAAAFSVNTYFVKLEQDAGLCNVVKMAKKAGVEQANGEDLINDSHFDRVPSFTLGSVEVTPLSLARSYATFANRGKNCAPIILKSVKTRDGHEIPVPDGKCEQVMEPDVADGVNYVLRGVVEKGIGRSTKISNAYDMAGKTGTTNDAQAVWFAGYTPELTGVSMITVDKTHSFWANRKQTLSGLKLPHSGNYLSGSSSRDSGGIFKDAMSKALTKYEPTKFVDPSKDIMEGKSIPIPDVSGMGYDQTKEALVQAGFKTVDWWVPSQERRGKFLGISQAGTARIGSTIYLKLSAGREAQPAPTEEPER